MDFDPTQFLAMDLSEEQNTIYTAPDMSYDNTDSDQTGTAVVEGGLQMEQVMQIPVPVFDTLVTNEEEEEEDDVMELIPEDDTGGKTGQVGEPMFVDTISKNSPASQVASGPSSPQTKRAIPTSSMESCFRKEFYNGNFDRVKLFRLHCTICDTHLGCAPWLTERNMRMHKLLNVAVCRRCFDFYGNINDFPINEDGTEAYCCWCGEGGEVFCCSQCPKIVCKNCIIRNFGSDKVQEITENDNWKCFVCEPSSIWPHRACFMGLQRLGKEARQKVAMLEKEKRIPLLSLDNSHCCLKMNEQAPAISLPRKSVMSKIPMCLIARAHQEAVRSQPDQPIAQNFLLGQLQQRTVNNNSSGFIINNTNKNQRLNNTPNFMNNPSQKMYMQNTGAIRPSQNVGSSKPNNNILMNTMVRNIMHPQRPNFLSNQQMRSNQQMVSNQQMRSNHQMMTNSQIRSNQQAVMGNQLQNYRGPPNQQVGMRNPTPKPAPVLPYTSRVNGNTRIVRNVTPFKHSGRVSTPAKSIRPGEVIDLVEDAPASPAKQPETKTRKVTANYDISWIEKGVRDIRGALAPLSLILDNFALSCDDLKQDFANLTNYTEKLSHNMKLAICSLAKINQDIMDASKSAIDNKVSNVVRDIQMNGLHLSGGSVSQNRTTTTLETVKKPTATTNFTQTPSTTQTRSLNTTPDKSGGKSSSLSADESGEDYINPALLCETVIQEDMSKENQNSEKSPKGIVVRRQVAKRRSAPASQKLKSPTKSLGGEVVVIESDDDDNDVEKKRKLETYYFKKYNLKQCKVELTRLSGPLCNLRRKSS